MRVVQKVSRIEALAHFRRGGMVSFQRDGSHAYTIRNSSESDLLYRLEDDDCESFIVTGVNLDEVSDKLVTVFPLHQVLNINGTEYAVRKVRREPNDSELTISLEAREGQPHAYLSLRVRIDTMEN